MNRAIDNITPSGVQREVVVPAGSVELGGELNVPSGAKGVVLFAHGSGSSRNSPRNQRVACILRESGLGTLLFDLLTQAEEAQDLQRGHLRFDIPFLAGRLVDATRWLTLQDVCAKGTPFGYFGSSTGGGAALVAASRVGENVGAVVSRGGRPDLAAEALGLVRIPTLLIVGGRDEAVIEMNEQAFAQLDCVKELAIIPDATHLFEEPGALDEVARLAAAWFGKHFGGGGKMTWAGV